MNDNLTICPDCNQDMEFLRMSGTEKVWFEDWECLKCGSLFQIEVRPKKQQSWIDELPAKIESEYFNKL